MINIGISCAAGSLKKYEAFYFKKKSVFKDSVRLIGLDLFKNKIDKKYFDFFEKLPKADNKTYLNRLKKIIIKHNIDIVFIGADEEAIIISKNIKLFKNLKVKFMINNYKTIKIISNKAKTLKKLSSIKNIIPIWNEAKNKKELLKLINLYLEKFKEVVIKPAVSRGGRNVFVIKKNILKRKNISSREKDMDIKYFLKNYLKKINSLYPFIVMEKLKNPIFDLDILANKGKLVYALLRKRLIPRDPNSGHKIIAKKNIRQLAKKIAKKLNLDSINDCDFMLDKNNNLKLLELNPRPSGSFAVPNLLEINLLDYLVAYNMKILKKIKLSKVNKNMIITKKQLIKMYNE